jgi:hypothetical protein
MKIKVVIIVALSLTLTLPNIGYSADGRLCQKGVYVFFENGVWNDEGDADSSRRLLTRRLESKVSGTDLESIITYAIACNPTEGALQDLLETFEQNLQTDYSQFWRFLSGLEYRGQVLH